MRAFRLCSVSLLLLASALSGCSIFHPGSRSDRVIDSATGADPSVTPFRLDVLSESVDGDKLSVRGRVVAKSERSADDVLVRMTATDTGGEQRVSYARLADIAPGSKRLSPNNPTPFTLSIPASGVSNYQLEVLWGADAEPYMAEAKASLKQPAKPSDFVALRNLEVHRVPDGSCSSPEECMVTFSIKGEIFNSGRATIRDLVLVAGFVPAAKLDLPGQILENEKRIEVNNLRLAPQGVKPFRLSLEKVLPASDTVAYQPVVRIASFETDL